MRTLTVGLLLALLAPGVLSACESRSGQQTSESSAQSRGLEPVVPYPLARWRLADQTVLGDVVLWVSHIVIRHREAESFDPCFSAADWHSPPSRGASRERLEGLALAREVARRAKANPEQFAQLAREYSDDDATRERGGSLGGLPASHLVGFDNVLDALAVTPVGSTTDVVETPYGYHVFYRRPRPPAQTVTGRRLVIGHDAAGWLKVVGRQATPPSRSRDRALEIANRLYDEAKSQPDQFGALVERHSEHRDAVRGGDMGTWSNDEPVPAPREVELLEHLAPGEIAPPVDSPVGFQIIQRLAERERPRYAMQALRLGFNPKAPDESEKSRRAVWAAATELAATLREHPERFDALLIEHCCATTEQWIDGRGSPPLTHVLDQLSVGQIAPEPVQSEYTFVIAKKLTPQAVDRVATRYELPEPKAADVAYFMSHYGGTFPQQQLDRILTRALAVLELTGTEAEAFRRLHHPYDMPSASATLAERAARYRQLLDEVERLLGSERFERYVTLVNSHFESVLLDPLGI